MISIATTTPDRDTADRLARLLVEHRLAACVQIEGPIHSVYRWQGSVATDEEWRLQIKTTEAAWPAVERLVIAEHPYDTPQLIATTITHTAPAYAGWLTEQVRVDPAQRD